jgi:hypothetical protein
MKIKVTWRKAGQKNRQNMNDDLCLAFYSTCSESNKSDYFLCNAAYKIQHRSVSGMLAHSACLVNCYFSPPLFCVYSVGDGAGAEILSEILIFKLGCMSYAAGIPTLLPSPLPLHPSPPPPPLTHCFCSLTF